MSIKSESYEERYEHAIRLANQWLEDEGRSQAFLAKQLGVDRSVLTRFLNREGEVYRPSPGRPRILRVLEGIERLCKPRSRDIFLSHRSKDKEFVRKLAADIQAHDRKGERLLTWLDEAEIRPGQSIPASINRGLETSRFIALILTPSYFDKNSSGWTDAEWHSVLHADPDNRGGKLIPILAENCPYIPALLRHLSITDCRGKKYEQGLEQLLRILRDEPLPRPVTYRGELIEPAVVAGRARLIAERTIPEADPDPVPEKIYSNLLPIEQLPRYVYFAPLNSKALKIARNDKSGHVQKPELIKIVRKAQEGKRDHVLTPAFRLDSNLVVSFHDLESPESLLAPITDQDQVEFAETRELLRDDVDRSLVLSLVNMAIERHLHTKGLASDLGRYTRFYFRPEDGKSRVIEWIPLKNKAKRTVTKPFHRNGQPDGWMHHACYIRALLLASRPYIQLVPTRLLTDDGEKVRGGPKVGGIVNRWLAMERNLHILYHIRFWTTVLRRGPGPISIRAGDQWIEVAAVPAFAQQSYGIANDKRDLLRLLDQEAPHIAEHEEAIDEFQISAAEPDDQADPYEFADDDAEAYDEGS